MGDDAPSQVMWLADNLASFSIQITAVLAAVALALYLTRSPRFATVILVIALPFAAMVWSAWQYGGPVEACTAATLRLRVASANLLFSNRDIDAVAAFLAAVKPDVVAVQEAGDWWDDQLPKVTGDYAYHAHSPQDATQLFSRYPFVSEPRPHVVPSLMRSVAADIETGEGRLRILAVHLTKPTTAEDSAMRRTQMDEIAEAAGEAGMPVVVMGDFNTAPTSLDFRAMIGGSVLSAPALQVPPVATWPARFGALGIEIDHVLVTDPLVYERVAAGPPTGSNHLPVFADLAVRPDGGCAAD